MIPQTIPTGRSNMLSSLREYLVNNLPATAGGEAYTVEFEQYENVNKYPSIAFQDAGIPQLGGHYFDDYMGELVDSNSISHPVYGKTAQTNVEFMLSTDYEQQEDAIRLLYQMVDQLEYLFMYSGRSDASGVNFILPRIGVLDFDNGKVDTGATIWAPMEKDSIFIPQYLGTDIERPSVRRLRVLVRVYWHLLRP